MSKMEPTKDNVHLLRARAAREEDHHMRWVTIVAILAGGVINAIIIGLVASGSL